MKPHADLFYMAIYDLTNVALTNVPGRPSMDILVRSCQDLGKILAKILPRYWQELQDIMVRSYQESHVSKKTFVVKSYLEKKSERKSTKINISADLYC